MSFSSGHLLVPVPPSASGRPAARHGRTECQSLRRWGLDLDRKLPGQPAESGPMAAGGGSVAATFENGSTRSATGGSLRAAFATASPFSKCRRLRSADLEGRAHQSESDQRWARSVSILRRSGQRDSESSSLWRSLVSGWCLSQDADRRFSVV